METLDPRIDPESGEFRKFDEHGRELMDPTPVAPNIKIKTFSETARLRALVQGMLSQAAADNDMDTFEDADDFAVGDDFDPSTPYEAMFDPDGNELFLDNGPFFEETPTKPASEPTPPSPTGPAGGGPDEPPVGQNQ